MFKNSEIQIFAFLNSDSFLLYLRSFLLELSQKINLCQSPVEGEDLYVNSQKAHMDRK